MRKIAILFIAVSSLFLTFSSKASDPVSKDPITNTNSVPLDSAAQIKVLEERLNEIKEMDKSELTRAEKKELKTEVKKIKSKMKALSGGVYISAGALIVVLILLIILL